jgi:hypothetical protein
MKCAISALVVTAVLGLTGCAASRAAQRQRELVVAMRSIDADCQQRRASGEITTSVGFVQCGQDRIRQAMVESGYPYMDLVDLIGAYRMALAVRVDKGEMSKEEGNLQLAELRTRIATEEHQRTTLSAQAQAQRTQAAGAFLQGLGVWSQSFRNPIRCFQSGIAVVCQ